MQSNFTIVSFRRAVGALAVRFSLAEFELTEVTAIIWSRHTLYL